MTEQPDARHWLSVCIHTLPLLCIKLCTSVSVVVVVANNDR